MRALWVDRKVRLELLMGDQNVIVNDGNVILSEAKDLLLGTVQVVSREARLQGNNHERKKAE